MMEKAVEIGAGLQERFGDRVAVKFVDVTLEALQNHPAIKEMLGKAKLPLTVINGEPRFQGRLNLSMISQAVEGLIIEP